MKDDRSEEVRAIGIVFLVIPLLSVLARCYVRICMIKNFAVDDWLAVVCMVFTAAYAGLIIGGASTGVGRHEADLTINQKIVSMKIWYYGELIYILCSSLTRIAVGAFLLRVAVRKIHRHIIYGLLAVNIIFNLFYFIFTIFQCTPIRGFWTRMAGEQVKCRSDIAVDSTLASSALSVIIDWVFGILPAFILWKLSLPTKKKIGLAVVMGLGVLASAGPLARIPYTVSLGSTHDFLYDTVDVGIWSFLEPGLGLTTICILTLRPLFVKWFHAACSTVKSDAMSIGDMPSRPANGQANFQRSSHRVSIHGGHGVEEPRWTRLSDDSELKEAPVRKYGKAIRMTCEIRSVTDVDVVNVRSSRLTPPGTEPAKAMDYV